MAATSTRKDLPPSWPPGAGGGPAGERRRATGGWKWREARC